LAAGASLPAEMSVSVEASVIWGEKTIQKKLADRLAALNVKDFATADRIRAELLAQGIQLMDGKDANGQRVTTWEVKR